MMKISTIMAVFAIGFASVADRSVTERSSQAAMMASAQQEQQISFPTEGGTGQGQTTQDSKTA